MATESEIQYANVQVCFCMQIASEAAQKILCTFIYNCMGKIGQEIQKLLFYMLNIIKEENK